MQVHLLRATLLLSALSSSVCERYLERLFRYDASEFRNLTTYLTTLNVATGVDNKTTNRQVSNVSFHDDTPMERVVLPFQFPFLSQSYSEVYVSPNGGVSFDATVPCSCCFMGAGCDLSNSYQHWIAAFVSDFNPAEMEELLATEEFEAYVAAVNVVNGTNATPAVPSFEPSSGVFTWSSQSMFAVGWENIPFYDSVNPLYSFAAVLMPDARLQIVHSRVWYPEDLASFGIEVSWAEHWSIGLRGPWYGESSGYEAEEDGGSTVYPFQAAWDTQIPGVYIDPTSVANSTVREFCPVGESLCADVDVHTQNDRSNTSVGAVVHMTLTSVQMACGKVFDAFRCAIVIPTTDVAASAVSHYSTVAGELAVESALTNAAVYDAATDSFSCSFSVEAIHRYVDNATRLNTTSTSTTTSLRSTPLEINTTKSTTTTTTTTSTVAPHFVSVALLYLVPNTTCNESMQYNMETTFTPPFRQTTDYPCGMQSWAALPSAFAPVMRDQLVGSATTTTFRVKSPNTTSTTNTTSPSTNVCDLEDWDVAYGACDAFGIYVQPDCEGICGGTASQDAYGSCCRSADKDCFGVCFGSGITSKGFVTSQGSMCCSESSVDCAGVCLGSAEIDDCGVCAGGTTNLVRNADKDCNGVCFGDCVTTNAPTIVGDDYVVSGDATMQQFRQYSNRACSWSSYSDDDWEYATYGITEDARDPEECAELCLDEPGCSGFEIGSFDAFDGQTYHYCSFWFNDACSDSSEMFVQRDPAVVTYVLFRDCASLGAAECAECPLWEWDTGSASCIAFAAGVPTPSPANPSIGSALSDDDLTHTILMAVVIAVTSFSLILCCALTISLIRRRRLMMEQRRQLQALGMSDVDIGASESIQLQTFTKGTSLEFGNECSICLVEFEHRDKIRKLRCGHHFHKACLDQWLHRQGTCPNCKLDVRPPQPQGSAERAPASPIHVSEANDENSHGGLASSATRRWGVGARRGRVVPMNFAPEAETNNASQRQRARRRQRRRTAAGSTSSVREDDGNLHGPRGHHADGDDSGGTGGELVLTGTHQGERDSDHHVMLGGVMTATSNGREQRQDHHNNLDAHHIEEEEHGEDNDDDSQAVEPTEMDGEVEADSGDDTRPLQRSMTPQEATNVLDAVHGGENPHDEDLYDAAEVLGVDPSEALMQAAIADSLKSNSARNLPSSRTSTRQDDSSDVGGGATPATSLTSVPDSGVFSSSVDANPSLHASPEAEEITVASPVSGSV